MSTSGISSPLHQERQQYAPDDFHRRYHAGASLSRTPAPTKPNWTTVHQLNNRGCVHVSMGNFTEANRIFEVALKKLMAVTQSISSSSPHQDCDIADEMSVDSDFDFGEDDDEDDEDCFKSDVTAHSTSHVSSPSPAAPASRQHRIQQMTTSSKVRIPSFSGQLHEDGSKSSPRIFHEVYCLPLVLDEIEWGTASLDDRAFVLIFNIAMCNHLWGMHFQHQGEEQNTCQYQQQAFRGFFAANKLYRLALNHASRVSHCSGSNRASIDYRLCVVAVLNNLSHIAKTLGDPRSPEARQFDQMLLNAIFWWRESGEPLQNNTSVPSGMNQHHSHDYVYADAQIIDLFLEHVFYLVGESDAVAPAAAA